MPQFYTPFCMLKNAKKGVAFCLARMYVRYWMKARVMQNGPKMRRDR